MATEKKKEEKMMDLSTLLYFLVSFPASIIGAICGIGGGVIIKPMLDLYGAGSVATISFLSGCTVLVMSLYSVEKNLVTHESRVDFEVATPLAIGAVLGGITGKQIFQMISRASGNPQLVGLIQSICLALVTLGTFLYTIKKEKIKTHQVKGKLPCVLVGLALGVLSSFLGIGGGPINLVVLFYLFSMDTKTAAQNSLYIILFSQFASLVTTLVTGSLPEFKMLSLLLMVIGGLAGGIMGRMINRRLDSKKLDRVFLYAMAVIILISCYNAAKFAM